MMTEDGKTEQEEGQGSLFMAGLAILFAVFMLGACVGMMV